MRSPITRQRRRRARLLAQDECLVERVTGEEVIDDEGRITVVRTTVYEGPCRVRTYQPYETVRESAGASVVEQRYSVHVPVTAGPFRPGDLVTIVGGQSLAVGSRYRIAGIHEETHQTAQRLLVDEEV